jgi:hypothetical protein
MRIATRLTERLGLQHPVISAPMALAAGGALAGAVSAAGGLGLIGGGYGDKDWLEREFQNAGNQPVGCGFITWSLAKIRPCSARRSIIARRRSSCPSAILNPSQPSSAPPVFP